MDPEFSGTPSAWTAQSDIRMQKTSNLKSTRSGKADLAKPRQSVNIRQERCHGSKWSLPKQIWQPCSPAADCKRDRHQWRLCTTSWKAHTLSYEMEVFIEKILWRRKRQCIFWAFHRYYNKIDSKIWFVYTGTTGFIFCYSQWKGRIIKFYTLRNHLCYDTMIMQCVFYI